LNGTPYPQPQGVISAENVDRIQQLSLLSTGWGPQSVALSGDRRFLEIASAAGVHLYNAETLQELPFLQTNLAHGQVLSAALSFDGRLLATGDYSGTIEIWNVENHQLLQTFLNGHNGRVYSLAFSPDARMLVSGGADSRVIVWNVDKGSKIRTLWHRELVTQVNFSPDGSLIVSGSYDATIILWDVQTGQMVHTFWDTQPVSAIAISPDGRLLASGSLANTVTVWDIASKTKLYVLHHTQDYPYNAVISLAISSDGRRLASSSYHDMKLWNIETGEEIRTLGDQASANHLTFLPGDSLLLSGSAYDGTVKIWKVNSGEIVQDWPIGQNSVISIAFSPDGQRVAAGLFEDVMSKVWNVTNGQLLHTLSENFHGTNCDAVESLAFSPDSSRLVSASYCNYPMIRMWDVVSGESLQILDKGNGTDKITYSPDGHLLAWSSHYKITLWDVSNEQELRTWKAGRVGQWIHGLAFSPDGRLLAAGPASHTSFDGQVQLWDVESGKLVRVLADQLYDVGDLAFSPDGRLLAAVVGRHQIRIWEVESGRLLRTLRGHDEWLISLAFSPSGDLLASGGSLSTSYQPTIKFWQVASGKLLYTLSVAQLWSAELAFSPNGRLLLSGSFDGSVRLWGVLP
jgi:WD40 repeat protein